MTDGPLLWYLNRGTGVVLLVLFSLSVVLGVLATGGRHGRGLPRFVNQTLHRDVALLSIAALVAHVVTAVADGYVDIRWWDAVVPGGASYEPLWLGLGTLSLDLMAAIALTTLVRARLGHRAWRTIHVLSWAAWVVAVAHAIGIGTDLAAPTGFAVLPVAACVAGVLLALAVRLARVVRRPQALAPGRTS